MIAVDVVEVVRNQLSELIGVEPVNQDTIAVHTPFILDDGDRLGFYLISRDKRWLLTDHGDTVSRLTVLGRDVMGKGHIDRFNRLLSFYGVTQESGVLQLEAGTDELGNAVRMFTQAAFEAINLAKLPAEKTATSPVRQFREALRNLIAEVVPPEKVDDDWHHPQHDPEQIYPIDYNIHGGEDWYVFGVGKSLRALHAAVTILHYKQKRVKFKSLVIYENKESLQELCTKALDEVAAVTFPSISNRDEIEQFISGTVLVKAG